MQFKPMTPERIALRNGLRKLLDQAVSCPEQHVIENALEKLTDGYEEKEDHVYAETVHNESHRWPRDGERALLEAQRHFNIATEQAVAAGRAAYLRGEDRDANPWPPVLGSPDRRVRAEFACHLDDMASAWHSGWCLEAEAEQYRIDNDNA